MSPEILAIIELLHPRSIWLAGGPFQFIISLHKDQQDQKLNDGNPDHLHDLKAVDLFYFGDDFGDFNTDADNCKTDDFGDFNTDAGNYKTLW